MEPSIHMAERRERRGKRITAAAFLVVVGLLTAATVGLFGFLEANAAYGTVEDVYEPYLLQQGFLGRTPRGRIATKRGYAQLGRRPPVRESDRVQAELFGDD